MTAIGRNVRSLSSLGHNLLFLWWLLKEAFFSFFMPQRNYVF